MYFPSKHSNRLGPKVFLGTGQAATVSFSFHDPSPLQLIQHVFLTFLTAPSPLDSESVVAMCAHFQLSAKAPGFDIMQEETLLMRSLIEACPCQGNVKTDAKIPLLLSKILNHVILTRKHFFFQRKGGKKILKDNFLAG